ncbi:MAG: hypothetical protein Q4F67_15895, partial [Propionibacteriaceae bacterium]|nr:hypothetical protein [Propionibacteriaceae bacterium]
IPLALDRLVAALLAKEPADRPTGEQVVEQLRQLSVDPNAGTMLLPGTPAEAGGTAVLPGGGTAVLPGAAGGFAGARRSSFGETPDEPFRPVSPQRPATPVRPAPPPPVQRPYRDDVERADTRRRSTWPIIALVVLALALGITGANFLFGGDDTPMVPGETATPVASPTAEQTTPTRAPTTTRRPTTTRPATTAAPTTTAPPQTLAPTTTEPAQPTETNGNQGNKGDRNGGDGDSGNGDEGNSGEAATTDDTGVQNAIAEVESRAARQVLSAVWTEAKFSGEPDRFIEITEQMEKRGLISKSESRALTRAAEAALDA